MIYVEKAIQKFRCNDDHTEKREANIHISTISEAVFNYDSKNQQHNIISEIRIPRDIGAMLVGVALATSGAVIQGVTKNGLADPSLIGLNSGASFMLALTFAFY